jgi:hypothetical protein
MGTSKIWCLQRKSLKTQGRIDAAWQEPSIEDSVHIDKKAMILWSDLMQTPSGSKCAGDTGKVESQILEPPPCFGPREADLPCQLSTH